MSDLITALLIGYVQCGVLLAWYLSHRRVVTVRDAFEHGQDERDASLHELEAEVAVLRRQMREMAGQRRRGMRDGESPMLKQAKRRGALEMARRGMEVAHIAQTLNMRRTEVEMLVRLDRLQREAHPAEQGADRHWLETAS